MGDEIRTTKFDLRGILVSLGVMILTISVFLPARNHGFLNFDDLYYVTDNSNVTGGLTIGSFAWAFTTIDHANWHPLTWLSHMADAQLFGLNPAGHHLTSVFIHALSSAVMMLFLFRVTGAMWRSTFVALLFGLHPLHVESVAWIAERKDVLSALFCFLTLLLYSEYVAQRRISLYICSFLSFVLGLLSKPMLVTLPVVMLLMDFWPLGQLDDEQVKQLLSRLIKEKIAFVLSALVSCLITVYAQGKIGAISDTTTLPVALRAKNVLLSYIKYITKTLWPQDLAVLYPYPSSIPVWQAAGALMILLGATITAIRLRRRAPYLLVGWLWFLITLLPVIGLIQVGSQSMADRYTYIPSIGLFIMVAWGVPDLLESWRYRQPVLAALTGIILVVNVLLTRQQLAYWRDDVTLYQHALEFTSGNATLHNNLGLALAWRGEVLPAIQQYQEALRLDPADIRAHYNLGLALQAAGYPGAALKEYKAALSIDPSYEKAGNAMHALLRQQGLQ